MTLFFIVSYIVSVFKYPRKMAGLEGQVGLSGNSKSAEGVNAPFYMYKKLVPKTPHLTGYMNYLTQQTLTRK